LEHALCFVQLNAARRERAGAQRVSSDDDVVVVKSNTTHTHRDAAHVHERAAQFLTVCRRKSLCDRPQVIVDVCPRPVSIAFEWFD